MTGAEVAVAAAIGSDGTTLTTEASPVWSDDSLLAAASSGSVDAGIVSSFIGASLVVDAVAVVAVMIGVDFFL